MSRTVLFAFGFLLCAGPFLILPELVTPSWRTVVITLLTFVALGTASRLIWPWRQFRVSYVVFTAAVATSWLLNWTPEALGLRHFAGIGAGSLAMAVVATFCSTPQRLGIATLGIAFGAVAVLTLGLGSTYLGWSGQKLVVGSTEPVQTLRYQWLPQFKLPLPGLERNEGWVNSNALGGTALLLVPLSAGIAAAGIRRPGLWRVAGLVGALGSVLGIAILWMSRSRTALAAGTLTVILLALRWRRSRWPIFVGLILALTSLIYAATISRRQAPALFQAGVESTLTNLRIRGAIWLDARDQLMRRPIAGVGINQFHSSPRTAAIEPSHTHVAHAHNILLQTGLDIGLVGLTAYLIFIFQLLRATDRMASRGGFESRVAIGAALSLVAVHLFGAADAIALGAKVGLFQWLCAGLILAAVAQPAPSEPA